MKILVTDANAKHALAIVRCLGRAGFPPWVLSFRKGSLSGASRYCRGEWVLPPYQSDAFPAALMNLLKTESIDLLVPVGTLAFKYLVPLKAEIERYSQMISVGPDKLNLCFSKQRTYDFAESLGIPVPKTTVPKSLEQVVSAFEQAGLSFPCVIKSPVEMGINVVDYAHDPDMLESKYRNMCAEHQFGPESGLPLLQEYLPGDGCGFFAVYQQGRCGPTFQHHRLREMPPSGGYSVASESYRDDRVQAYGKTLLDGLGWHGVAMVEFKMNARGLPVLMEINPKFWGSTDLALAAGVFFPLQLIKIARGETLHYASEYRYPFRYHWPLHGDLQHAFLNPRKAFAVLRDCFDLRVKSNLWWFRDVRPTLVMWRRFLREGLTAFFRFFKPTKNEIRS